MVGAKRDQAPGGKRRVGLWVACGVTAGLLAAYLGLCAYVGASGKILPNVTVNGIAVGGMTRGQAEDTLARAVAQAGSQEVLNLTYGSWSQRFSGDNVRIRGAESQDAAYQVGRANFFAQGGSFLAQLLGSGQEVPLSLELSDAGQAELLRLLDEADQEVGGSVTGATYQVEGDKLLLTKGVTGVAIDREQATQQVLDTLAQRMGDRVGRSAAGEHVSEVVLPAVETAPQDPDFDAIHAQVNTQPKDAEMDPETYQVRDHVVGVDFDISAARAQFSGAQEGETVAVPLVLTQPELTREKLEASLFQDLLGEATSQVSGSANRRHNVKLSAQACNDRILMPGETFSYNNTTGSRTTAAGYLPAPAYVGGKTEDEIGGGICQTSSTLYNAVLYTRLKIVERHNHMYAVGYVPDGMDATVYFGLSDFQFQNDTPYPVKIVTNSYDSGGKRYLNVKIYGTKTDDVTVKLERVRFDEIAPGIQYVADPSVPRGTQVQDKVQNPYTGRKATVYRYLYDAAGNLIEKQNLGVSSYRSRDRIIYYNPLDGDPSKPQTPPAVEPPVIVPPVTEPPATNPPDGSGGTTTPTEPVDPGVTEPVTPDPNTPPPETPGPDSSTQGGTVPDPSGSTPADSGGAVPEGGGSASPTPGDVSNPLPVLPEPGQDGGTTAA